MLEIVLDHRVWPFWTNVNCNYLWHFPLLVMANQEKGQKSQSVRNKDFELVQVRHRLHAPVKTGFLNKEKTCLNINS